MDVLEALANLVRLTFVQGAVAALLVLALARAGLAAIGVWQRTRRPPVRITVVGVGGAGGNAVDAMIRVPMRGLRFVAVNTDRQALRRSLAHERILIGKGSLGGLGTGGDPAIGEAAAAEDVERIARAVAGSDIVFVVAGLGGGTGSGATPAVAAAAKEAGALTIGVVTRPFAFEGTHRAAVAEQWAAALRPRVDALVAVPNDLVSASVGEDASLLDAFSDLDRLIAERVAGVVDLIGEPGRVNLDSSHVRSAMQDAGDTMMGIGRGRGEHGALEAVRRAMASAHVESARGGASRLLIHLAGSRSLAFVDVTAAVAELQSVTARDANVIFGATFDRRLRNETVATVIATAFADRRSESIGTPLRGGSVGALAGPAVEGTDDSSTDAEPAVPDAGAESLPPVRRRLRRPGSRTGTEG